MSLHSSYSGDLQGYSLHHFLTISPTKHPAQDVRFLEKSSKVSVKLFSTNSALGFFLGFLQFHNYTTNLPTIHNQWPY